MRLTTILASLVSYALLAASPAQAKVHAYGPGGPAPAMKEAAAVFEKETGVVVEVTAGPTGDWATQAKGDAEVFFSGSENMMTGFQRQFPDIVASSVTPLYLRESAILVRKGNPKRIRGIRDLLKPGLRVMIVEGAGQAGMWEDIAGRTGDIRQVRALRQNIVSFAENSGAAKQQWIDDPTIDAWIIWTIWQRANADLADQVRIERNLTVYRDTGVALTRKGLADPDAVRFAQWLSGAKASAIFAKWGWIKPK